MRLFVLFVLMALGQVSYSQSSLGNRQVRNGMAVLGIWSMHNMASGAIGWSQESGNSKYFNQMNLLWNTVNFGLALSGILNSDYSWDKAKSKKTEKLFLINAGLDFVYMGSGALLLSKSKSSDNYQDLMKGYGQSLILQGGFLLLFDGVMFLVLRNSRLKHLEIGGTANGVGLSYTF